METQLARAAALHTEPSGPACCNNNGWISRFLKAPSLCLDSACKRDTTFLVRAKKNCQGWRSQKFMEIRQAFPQTVTILFKHRPCVLLGALSCTNGIFLQRVKQPAAFKRSPVDAAFFIPTVKAGFHTFYLAFIVISRYFGVLISPARCHFSPPTSPFKHLQTPPLLGISWELSSQFLFRFPLITPLNDFFFPPAWVIPFFFSYRGSLYYFCALVKPHLFHPLDTPSVAKTSFFLISSSLV